MTTPTLDDLMRRTLAGQTAPATPDQYDDVLKLLAESGVAPDPTEDVALKEMLEDKGSIEAGVLADAVEGGSQPLGDRTSKMLKDAALRRLYESGEKPASRAYAEALPDEMPAPPPVTEPTPPTPEAAAAPAPAPAPAATPQLKTTPEALAEAQGKSKNVYTTLATGQPPEGAPASASPYTGHDAAEEERRNQEARRAAYAVEIREFLKKHPEATLDDAMGAREKEFREKHGEEYGGNKWLAGLTKEGIAAYEGGSKDWADRLAKAREGDLASAKERKGISNSLIGVIARANPAIPIEEIAKLTEGDPLIKLLGQGALGQDEKLRTELLKLVGTGIKAGSDERNTLTRAGATVDAASINAAAKAKGKGGGGGDGGAAAATATRVELLDFLAQKEGIPISREDLVRVQADPKVARTLQGITPDQARQLENMAGIYNSQAGRTLQAQLNTAGQMDTKGAQGVDDTLQRKLKNPEFRWKFSKYAHEMGGAIGRAKVAWAHLSDNAKKIIAQIPPNNDWLVNLRNSKMDPRDQKLAASLESLGNMILKERSGSAVTEPEMARFAKESGFAGASLDLFNSPERLGQWLDNTMAQYRNTMDAWESIYGSFKPGPPPKGP